ncbi:MAG: hypothetical protein ACRDPE_23540 [Solirubrobacterales bacterium]
MGKLIDLEGQVFNRLTVEALAPKPWKTTRAEWVCVCVCGNEKVAIGQNLLRGRTQSCGCLRHDPDGHRVEIGVHQERHGHAVRGKTTRTYRSWESMKRRCLNPNANTFQNYGGRGITIDQRWIDSFEVFLREMGERPEGMTLDRIDNDKGYSKENCCWSTPQQQMTNTRRSKGKGTDA